MVGSRVALFARARTQTTGSSLVRSLLLSGVGEFTSAIGEEGVLVEFW